MSQLEGRVKHHGRSQHLLCLSTGARVAKCAQNRQEQKARAEPVNEQLQASCHAFTCVVFAQRARSSSVRTKQMCNRYAHTKKKKPGGTSCQNLGRYSSQFARTFSPLTLPVSSTCFSISPLTIASPSGVETLCAFTISRLTCSMNSPSGISSLPRSYAQRNERKPRGGKRLAVWRRVGGSSGRHPPPTPPRAPRAAKRYACWVSNPPDVNRFRPTELTQAILLQVYLVSLI